MDTRPDRSRRGARRRRLTAGLSATLLASALMGTTSPATAGDTLPNRAVLIDGHRDVYWYNPELGRDVKVSKPTADVTRATARYGRYAVIMRMRFVNLRRLAPAEYNFRLRTGTRFYRAPVETGARHWQGELWGSVASCAGEDHSVDYDDELVTIRIPRRCLGKPAWVRVQFSNALFDAYGSGEYFDNPHNDLFYAESWTPRIYRG